eukprot:m.100906 g.100906  ORF g.100906 m.100906 type:complete len:704 (-) comp13729_c0_seq3:1962-4073(-)
MACCGKKNETEENVAFQSKPPIVTNQPVYSQPDPAKKTSLLSTGNTSRDVYSNADAILESLIVPFDKVKLAEKLDSGQFGAVFAGTLETENGGPPLDVAVKMLKVDSNLTEEQRNEFLQEMTTMAQLQHKFILRQHAVVIDPLMIVMERVRERSLLNYMKDRGHNDSAPIPYPTLLRFALQSATGLKYLSEHTIVHRDIAARNILLQVHSRCNFACKVADFGLARVMENLIYSRAKGKKAKVPARWTAPEALFDGRFSTKSDVWAWAVMVWELTTCGQFPYTVYWEDMITVKLIVQGLRLHQAEMVPNALYDLLKSCWEATPEARPSFSSIVDKLANMERSLTAVTGSHPAEFRTLSQEETHRVQSQNVSGNGTDSGDCYALYASPSLPIFVPVRDPGSVELKKLYRQYIRPKETPSYFPATSPYLADIDPNVRDPVLCAREDRRQQVSLLAIGPRDLIPLELPLLKPVQQIPDTYQDTLIYDNINQRGSFLELPAYGQYYSGSEGELEDNDDIYGTRVVYTAKQEYSNQNIMQQASYQNVDIDASEHLPEHSYRNIAPAQSNEPTLDLIEKLKQREEEDEDRFPKSVTHADRDAIRQWLNAKPNRNTAEAAIANAGSNRGDFVVRAKDSEFVVDVCKNRDKVLHFRLRNAATDPDMQTTLINPNGDTVFPSLWAFIAFYRKSDPLTLVNSLGGVRLADVVDI